MSKGTVALVMAMMLGGLERVSCAAPSAAGGVFTAPLVKADLDPATFSQWVEGVESPALFDGKAGAVARLVWTRDAAQDYVGDWSFGGGKDLGPRHLRIGFGKAVRIGTILARGDCAVSVLKPEAGYPGDLADDSQWLAAERLAGGRIATDHDGGAVGLVWTLPAATDTRAIRFTHIPRATDRDYAGRLHGVSILSERFANIAPLARATASANGDVADRVINGWPNTHDPWNNWNDANPPRPIADQSPWLTLSWDSPQNFRGLATLFSGFSAAEVSIYSGPADRHPAEAGDADWKRVKSFSGISNGYPLGLPIAWLDINEPLESRAVRLRMTRASTGGHPHVEKNDMDGRRVWLDELIVLKPMGGAALASILPKPATAAEPHPPIPVRFKLEEPASVTLVIDDAEGRRVRNLISETRFPAGDNVAWWDGMDDLGRDVDAARHGLYEVPGRFVAPGTYTVRGLASPAIDLLYEFPVYTEGNPAWNTIDNSGAWLSNHSPPGCALFVPAARSPASKDLVYLGSHVSEGTHGLAWVDLDGRKVGGVNWVGGIWTGAESLALDQGEKADPNTILYVGSTFDGELRLTAMMRGKERAVFKHGEKKDGNKNDIGGLAVRDGLLVCAVPNRDKLLFIDAAAGKLVGEAAVAGPQGLAFDARGRLLVLSGKTLLRFAVGASPQPHVLAPPETLVAKGLEEPEGLALAADGTIFVSDWGASHQVKVFSAEGKPLRTVGKPGAPKAGRYDPLHMNHPAGLAVDSQGRLWVAERDELPKRVSVWNTEGRLVRAFYGPAQYGGGGTLDPQDKTLFHYQGMTFKLDWEKGSSELVSVYWRPEMGRGVLPDGYGANGPPQSPIYAQQRKYLSNAFNSNPTAGASIATLWLEKDGLARPIAAVGRANDWSLLKRDAFRSRWPQGVDPQGEYWRNVAFCVWSDLDDDGTPQPEEVDIVAGDSGGVIFMPDLAAVASRRAGQATRLSPVKFTPGGAPVYDIDAGEVLASDVQPPASSGGDQALAHPDGWTVLTAVPKPFSPFSVAGVFKGQPRWSYPSLWPGLHASHEAAVPDRPGMLVGTTRLLGGFITPRKSDVGPLWCLNGNMGPMYLLTADGLFVATLFKDSRLGASWSMPKGVRGMNLNTLTPSTENFWPSINQTADGEVWLVDGARSSLVRVTGLEAIRRLPAREITVTAQELQQARDSFAAREAARQAALGRKRLTVAAPATPPAVDGKLDDWTAAEWVSVDKRGAGANFDSTSKPYDVQVAVAVAGDHLFTAFRTADPNLLQNSGGTPNALFKTGGGLDLMLGTDPAADPKRTTPVPGDLRLLVTRVKGQTAATLYRAVVPGTSEADRVPFSSPWRTIHFDQVRDVGGEITLAGADGNYEISAPLALLGLKPGAGQRLKADIGVLRGDGFQTQQRVYWSNKATGLTADVPGEALLTPNLWGEWEFH
ncbi:MAG: hypothetical protein ACKO9I_20010 [Sphaerospermopsis kisseleviana]